MNIEQFEDLVDRFGERPESWPDDMRAEAAAFLETSQEARDFVAEAVALRQMFQGTEPEKAPTELAGRIVALAGYMDEWRPSFVQKTPAPTTPVHGGALFFNSGRLPRPYIWLACCFAAGLGLGFGFGSIPGTAGGLIDFATLFAVIGS